MPCDLYVVIISSSVIGERAPILVFLLYRFGLVCIILQGVVIQGQNEVET